MPDETTRFLKEEASRLMDENRDLREELTALRQSVRALSALYYLSQEIKPETDVLQLLTDILESALVVLKASDGSLMLVDEETSELGLVVARGGNVRVGVRGRARRDRRRAHRVPRPDGTRHRRVGRRPSRAADRP